MGASSFIVGSASAIDHWAAAPCLPSPKADCARRRTRMKRTIVLLSVLAAVNPSVAGAAGGKICINPRWSYEAHALDAHTVVAKSTIGSDHRELRLDTTCIDLKSAFRIALSTTFSCIDMGDTVVATTIDG